MVSDVAPVRLRRLLVVVDAQRCGRGGTDRAGRHLAPMLGATMSDRELEMETIIRWDSETDAATLYTADPRERRRWQQLGYPVEVCGTTREGKARGWQATVPIAAVALLPLRAGQVRAPRWLEPPTLTDRVIKAQGPREPEKADENIQEIRAEFPAGARTAAG